jgi:hypothetical protein
MIGTVPTPVRQRHPDRYVNTSAFSAPPSDELGNAKLDSVVGPGLVHSDFALLRAFHLPKENQLPSRAESFSLAIRCSATPDRYMLHGALG